MSDTDTPVAAPPALERSPERDRQAIVLFIFRQLDEFQEKVVKARMAADPEFRALAFVLGKAWVRGRRKPEATAARVTRVSWSRRLVGWSVGVGALGAAGVVGYIRYTSLAAAVAQTELPTLDDLPGKPPPFSGPDTAALRAAIDSASRRAAARNAADESVLAARKRTQLASAPEPAREQERAESVTTPAVGSDTATSVGAEEPTRPAPDSGGRREPLGGPLGRTPLIGIRVPGTSRSKVQRVDSVSPGIRTGYRVETGRSETLRLPLPDGGTLILHPESRFTFGRDSAGVMNGILTGEAVLELPPETLWQMMTVGVGFNLGAGRYAVRSWKAEDGTDISIERGRVYAAGDSVVGAGVFARVMPQPLTLTRVEDGSGFPVIVPPEETRR